MNTKNIYHYPVVVTDDVKIDYTSSPAHTGNLKHAVDFIMDENLPVYAALDGEVVDIKQDSNVGGDTSDFDKHGNYIEIRHPHEEYSIYEHISPNSCLVAVGEKVFAGQEICKTGATGWLGGLGSHLHFDVHVYVSETEYESKEIVWC